MEQEWREDVSGGVGEQVSLDFWRLPSPLIESASPHADRREVDRNAAERRQTSRAIVDADAKLCITLTRGIDGHLLNLSAQGCSLNVPAGPFRVGHQVWFRIEPIEPWRGIIRWVNGDEVGVEFDRPFYPAVFDQLVKSNRWVRVSTGM